jgi:hypothetical protein
MDLRKTLLKEHSKNQCNKIVKWIGEDQERFAELMNLFFDGEYRVTQRAAWPMSYCVAQYPKLISPYFKKLIDNLSKKGLHNAIYRNTLRLLQFVETPKQYHGKLMSSCFDLIQSNGTPSATKAFSLTILENLSKQYPDIKSELKLIIEERWEHEKPAFISRARKIMNT